MANSEKVSGKGNNSTLSASGIPYPYSHLTKSELVELYTSGTLKPLTEREFIRASIALVPRWCADVHRNRFASMVDLSDRLSTLEKIYRNR